MHLFSRLFLVLCVSLSVASASYVSRTTSTTFAVPTADGYRDRVDAILKATPLIDGHDDLPFLIRYAYKNRVYGANFTLDSNFTGEVDIPRLKKGHVGGTFWSVFVECPKDNSSFADSVYTTSLQETLQQIDLVHRLIAQYPSSFALATTSADVIKAHASGQIASFIGAEGLHSIGNSASNLRLFYELGVRYVTLTHICNNKYADGANARGGPVWNGLSPDGRDIVREMNRIGMMVDLSHVTAKAMRDALEITTAPVIFSHSSAYALCPNERNVPDDVLRSVKKNGGIVMVNFYPAYVYCGPGKDPKNATLQHVADHIEYIAKMIGWEHVGLGSDFDGIESTPKGLEDVSKFPDLFVELLKRGVGDKEAGLLAGGNILRVLTAVEAVAEKMQSEGVQALEDVVADIPFS